MAINSMVVAWLSWNSILWSFQSRSLRAACTTGNIGPTKLSWVLSIEEQLSNFV